MLCYTLWRRVSRTLAHADVRYGNRENVKMDMMHRREDDVVMSAFAWKPVPLTDVRRNPEHLALLDARRPGRPQP